MRRDRASSVEAARVMLGMTLEELWVDYLGLGGSLLPDELGRFLQGLKSVSNHEYDIAVQAVNDRFLERGQKHPVAYADERPED